MAAGPLLLEPEGAQSNSLASYGVLLVRLAAIAAAGFFKLSSLIVCARIAYASPNR